MKKEVEGMTEENEDKEKDLVKESSFKKVVFYAVLFIIVGIGGVVGKDLGKATVAKFTEPKTSSEIIKKEWQRYTLKNGFSLTAPEPLVSQQMPTNISEKEKQLIEQKVKDFESYTCKIGNLACIVTVIKYADDILASPEGAVDEMISKLSQEKRTKDFKYKTIPLTISNSKGLIVLTTYRMLGRKVIGKGVVLGDGPNLWTIYIVYPELDKNAKIIATKIIDSIQIN